MRLYQKDHHEKGEERKDHEGRDLADALAGLLLESRVVAQVRDGDERELQVRKLVKCFRDKMSSKKKHMSTLCYEEGTKLP